MIKAFGSDENGKKAGEAACRAIGMFYTIFLILSIYKKIININNIHIIGALATVGQIDTMITNFLVPLQVFTLIN